MPEDSIYYFFSTLLHKSNYMQNFLTRQTQDPALDAMELEKRVLEMFSRVLDDDPHSNKDLRNVLEQEIARRVEEQVRIKRNEMKMQFEIETEKQLSKAREEINVKLMEIEMTKMFEKSQQQLVAQEEERKRYLKGPFCELVFHFYLDDPLTLLINLAEKSKGREMMKNLKMKGMRNLLCTPNAREKEA